jgi:hypothetical protein
MANLSYAEWTIPIEAFVEPQKNPASPKVSLRTGRAKARLTYPLASSRQGALVLGISLSMNEAHDIVHPFDHLTRLLNLAHHHLLGTRHRKLLRES